MRVRYLKLDTSKLMSYQGHKWKYSFRNDVTQLWWVLAVGIHLKFFDEHRTWSVLELSSRSKKFKWVSSSVKVDYGAVVSFHHFFYISRFMYLRFFDIGTSSVLGLSSWSNHLDFQRYGNTGCGVFKQGEYKIWKIFA